MALNRWKRVLCTALSLLVLCQLTACGTMKEPVQIPTTETQMQTLPPETEPTQPVTEQTLPPETEPATQPTEPEPTEPPKVSITQVPRYFQTDYPKDRFAYGTIANNGCSITCLAMVASYLTDHLYTPRELAKWFGPFAGSYDKRLEYANAELQLAWKREENWHKARQALWDGKVLIVMLGSKSQFTENQHFVVITGFTEDGKYLINDPNEENYSHWDLREGFQKGFEEWQISGGYQCAWSYDKTAMPEEPFIYEVPERVMGDARYPELELSEDDLWLLASMIWIEAQGEPMDGQQAIAEVVLNRMVADNFPSKVEDILFADGQFPSMEKLDHAEPSQTQYEAIERAIYGPYILPEDVVFFATTALNDHVWGTIGGHIFCYQW